jgi:hypothetical protein
MEGVRIPSDVANPANIQVRAPYVETREIRRAELWVLLLIASVVCAAALRQQLLKILLWRRLFCLLRQPSGELSHAEGQAGKLAWWNYYWYDEPFVFYRFII